LDIENVLFLTGLIVGYEDKTVGLWLFGQTGWLLKRWQINKI